MTAITIVPGTPGAPTPWDDLDAMWATAPCRWDRATGVAAFRAMARGPIRANLLMRRVKSVTEGQSRVYRGVRIVGLPDLQHRVERDGYPPLRIEHVQHYLDGHRCTALIWPDSDLYA